ncbi:restriction endonuclease [Serratia fonticola]|uniref:TOPRIM nucleotidyl transferase/hydrolase domain-containing protein n=1 Tax=Serratia fonticola TaxID=47917 RepID=UPI00192B6D59|nr:TOPRIM nucleotidyl transferase/hydrolase domain-containing protein [Serratia fonticola]MBL5864353.1 restriction endonuclease [Serratia fonticola]
MNSLDQIKQEYEELLNLPLDSEAAAKRRRGFAFEQLLIALFTVDELEPRAGYRPTGEQIDGSIYLDGRIYLLEAKWHADPLPASTLYQFKGKVDGKLAGTIGIFISMSGYSKDAVDALILGKDLNVILFDRRDMDAAIIRGSGFRQVLKFKLRKASEEGTIYFPAEAEMVTAENTQTIEIDHLSFDRVTDQVLATRPAAPLRSSVGELLIVCEGDSDRVIITTLVERILSTASSGRSIKIMTAMGKIAIPRIANALRSNFHPDSRMLIVTDGDEDPVGTAAMLASGIEFENWIACIPNPSIETWLGLDREGFRRVGGKLRLEKYRHAANQVDIKTLRLRDEQFDRFYNVILGELPDSRRPPSLTPL